MGKAIGNLIRLAVIAAVAYGLWKWEFAGSDDDDAMVYAEISCVDEIRSRYATTTVSSHSVRETNNGYVVRGSMTLARGGTAKVTCLTNENGRVRDIMVEER